MADVLGDELFPGHGLLVPRLLVLGDVARGDELVAYPEAGVGPLGGLAVHHEVVERRVELGERAVGLLTPVLDADAGVEPGVLRVGLAQFGCGSDEAVEAHLGRDGHC